MRHLNLLSAPWKKAESSRLEGSVLIWWGEHWVHKLYSERNTGNLHKCPCYSLINAGKVLAGPIQTLTAQSSTALCSADHPLLLCFTWFYCAQPFPWDFSSEHSAPPGFLRVTHMHHFTSSLQSFFLAWLFVQSRCQQELHFFQKASPGFACRGIWKALANVLMLALK